MARTPATLALATLAALGLAAALPRPAHAQGYSFTAFDFPGAADTAALGINNGGQIVGQYDVLDSNGNYDTTGFTVNAASLADPDGYLSYGVGGAYTELDGINDAGQVVGDYVRSSDGDDVGFTLDGLGHDDFLPAGETDADPYAINNHGDVSGYVTDENGVSQGFVRAAGGTFTFFNDPDANAEGTFGTGINDAGTTVGYYRDSNGDRTAFEDKGGVFSGLPALSGDASGAVGINNLGDIAGFYRVPDGTGAFGPDQGFLLTAGGTLITLDVPGATDTVVQAVNDSGQAVGYYLDADGFNHAFIAVPAPEPSACAGLTLGALGLGALALRARSRRASA